ncbi:hypothetical protein [Natrialba sp. SSL1]|uniref:hypothetical protein n=1 Tax=Natrialba sp. SSL1 TaxID=1869245 RepID=UPI0008F96497|nr:hypothetical protein [Natrialba sp. SSL1]OIB58701.1 hypothetical protein BBD46_07690 [Natrialba sp. SSL1]
MLWGILALLAILYTILFGPLATLVYWDSKRSGIHGPAKWAGFVFLTGFLGLVLYISDKDDEFHDPDDADPFSLPGTPPAGAADSDDSTEAVGRDADTNHSS